MGLNYLCFFLFLFVCSCTTTVNNYYTIVEDSAAHNKKLLAGRWLLADCSGYDSTYVSNAAPPARHTTYSYDTSTHTLTIGDYVDTSLTPRRTNVYVFSSMVFDIDSNGYYDLREAYTLNGSASRTDSFASPWTYIWTGDSSSSLLLNPSGTVGIFALAASGYSSSSGNLIVQYLDSTKLILAAKNKEGSSGAAAYYYHTDVRFTFRK